MATVKLRSRWWEEVFFECVDSIVVAEVVDDLTMWCQDAKIRTNLVAATKTPSAQRSLRRRPSLLRLHRNHGAAILLKDLQGPSSSIRVSPSVSTPRPLSMSLSLLTSMVILTSIAATPN